MEKKYQCKLWAKELSSDNTCRYVSGVVVRDRQVVITTSAGPAAISEDLAYFAVNIFSMAENVSRYKYEISHSVCSSDVLEG